ncbi:MAG: hypothetical protein N2606_04895, partial [Candidatus Omnitrophica bacterium]|nr:hypothetical protein [Candidatus Omnitrophota bacterium]
MFKKNNLMKQIIALTVIVCFGFEQTGFAQLAPQIPLPGYLNGYISPDRFRPMHLRYLAFDPIENDLTLLLEKGDVEKIVTKEVESTTRKLLEFFKIGLTLPSSTFWVNLRPDSPDNVIEPLLEKTDVGKIMLEADLQLKKDMARFTSPNTVEGRTYWDKLYAKIETLFASEEEVEIPTFTRPWIVPGEIIIGETPNSAYIYKATLKVMLEQDYLKDSNNYNFSDPRIKQLNEYSSSLIRELIIPKLTREVNSSKKYASLRQVYYSLILAQWFKQRFNNQDNPYSKIIDKADLTDLTSKTPWSSQKYFQEYQRSFYQGEYDIEESIVVSDGVVVRRYFSGGLDLSELPSLIIRNIQEFLTSVGNVPVKVTSGGLIEVVGKIKKGVSNLPEHLTMQNFMRAAKWIRLLINPASIILSLGVNYMTNKMFEKLFGRPAPAILQICTASIVTPSFIVAIGLIAASALPLAIASALIIGATYYLFYTMTTSSNSRLQKIGKIGLVVTTIMLILWGLDMDTVSAAEYTPEKHTPEGPTAEPTPAEHTTPEEPTTPEGPTTPDVSTTPEEPTTPEESTTSKPTTSPAKPSSEVSSLEDYSLQQGQQQAAPEQAPVEKETPKLPKINPESSGFPTYTILGGIFGLITGLVASSSRFISSKKGVMKVLATIGGITGLLMLLHLPTTAVVFV